MIPPTTQKPNSNFMENIIDITALGLSPLLLELEARFLIAVVILYVLARSIYYCALSGNVCMTAIRHWRRARRS